MQLGMSCDVGLMVRPMAQKCRWLPPSSPPTKKALEKVVNERTLDLLLTTEKELSMREKTAECRCNPKFLLFVSGVAHEHAYVVLLIMRPVNMHSESCVSRGIALI